MAGVVTAQERQAREQKWREWFQRYPRETVVEWNTKPTWQTRPFGDTHETFYFVVRWDHVIFGEIVAETPLHPQIMWSLASPQGVLGIAFEGCVYALARTIVEREQ
jgi:hypothetical protein